MDNPPPPHRTRPSDSPRQKRFIGKTGTLTVGLVLAIIGIIVAGAFEKGTLTNYVGFGMLLVGIAAFVLGTCSVLTTNVTDRVQRENPDFYKSKKRLPINKSIYAIGVGVVLVFLGSMFASTYDRAMLMNTVGFGLLLTGVGVLVMGLSGVALETVKMELSRNQRSKVKAPNSLFYSIISLGVGVVFLVVGTILAGTYAKDTLFNNAGFGMLIAGVGILCLSASGTVVAMLKTRLYSQDEVTDGPRSLFIFSSIWALGIGIMLLIVSFIISGNFAQNTLMNYTGFGMLLSGVGIFVYGLFETAKASVMGYLNYKLIRNAARQVKDVQRQQSSTTKFKFTWKNMVKTNSVFNLIGIITAVCLLFFSIWQLDMIVSGPVWWSSGAQGTGTGWSHLNGAYANDYFQCFLWKTTIGQAYDTLFLLIFVSFIVMFLSAYFWPKQDRDLLLKLKNRNGETTSRSLHFSPEEDSSQSEATAEPAQSASPTTIDEDVEAR